MAATKRRLTRSVLPFPSFTSLFLGPAHEFSRGFLFAVQVMQEYASRVAESVYDLSVPIGHLQSNSAPSLAGLFVSNLLSQTTYRNGSRLSGRSPCSVSLGE